MLNTPKHRINTMITTVVLTILTLGSTSSWAACTNANLVGTFYVTIAQIFVTSAGTDYCDEYGTAIANGAGRIQAKTTRRCSYSGSPTSETGKLVYKVSPDCSVALTELKDDGSLGQPSHGKILMRGDMLLVDGTSRTDDSKLMHVIAIRTSKNKKFILAPHVLKK